MKNFQLLKPETLAEALQTLSEYPGDALPLAGGTDLIVDMRSKRISPKVLVDLSKISTLTSIKSYESFLWVGSMVTLHAVDQSKIIRQKCTMLSEGASVIGSRQIRNLATLGGNNCNAVPSADTSPALMAAEATVVIQNLSGTRRLPIDKFFLGPRKKALDADEIVTGFEIPIQSGKIGSIYRRNTVRKALDLAKVGVAVQVVIDPKTKVIQQIAIALGAVAPTPIRAREAENILTGNPIREELLNTAAELSAQASRPISDVRSNETYRKKMVQVLTKQCLVEAISRSEMPVSGGTQ